MQGLVHSIETFGSVDGPGVRFVVFLQGCRLRCRYCHNPDTWSMTNANARNMEASALLQRALRYRTYWGPRGGITVSGGEPLLQMDFLIEFFRMARKKGIHTVIDTAGQPFTREEPFYSKFLELMELTDLVLLDMKQLDRLHKPVWIRHVLVPGWTDGEEGLRELAAFLRTLSNVEKIEVLPYHTLGVYKYQALGYPEPLPGVPPADMESKVWAEKILRGEL